MNCHSSCFFACFFVLSQACIFCRLASALLVVILLASFESWLAWSAADQITAQLYNVKEQHGDLDLRD